MKFIKSSFCTFFLAMYSLPVSQSVEFVVLGDLPYGSEAEVGAEYRQLISSINDTGPSLVVHVGDIKSGSMPCSDEEFDRQRAYFSMFDGPLIYTPGDNEWTDCHRKNNGAYDPLERLKTLRSVFFDKNYVSKNSVLNIRYQSESSTKFADYVENQIWTLDGTLFVTIHVVGSNNNLDATTQAGKREFLVRERANNQWLKEAFLALEHSEIHELVVLFHGDPHMDWMMPFPSFMHPGFKETIDNHLLRMAQSTEKRVLIVHGDTHTFRWDHPVPYKGRELSNVSRLVVPGARDIRAVKVIIDRTQRDYYQVEVIE